MGAKRKNRNEANTGAPTGAPSSQSSNAAPSGSDSGKDEAEELQRMLEGDSNALPSGDKDAQQEPEPKVTPAPKATKPEVKPKPESSKKNDEGLKYFVEENKSVTTRKGIRGEHTEIRPEYFGGNVKVLDNMVRRGLLYKAKFARNRKGDREADLAKRVHEAREKK